MPLLSSNSASLLLLATMYAISWWTSCDDAYVGSCDSASLGLFYFTDGFDFMMNFVVGAGVLAFGLLAFMPYRMFINGFNNNNNNRHNISLSYGDSIILINFHNKYNIIPNFFYSAPMAVVASASASMILYSRYWL